VTSQKLSSSYGLMPKADKMQQEMRVYTVKSEASSLILI
jgi:hypothetical protein